MKFEAAANVQRLLHGRVYRAALFIFNRSSEKKNEISWVNQRIVWRYRYPVFAAEPAS